MRKTKRFAPLICGLFIILFLSFRYNDQLLIEQILGNGMIVIGVIVILYAVAIYVIIKGLARFNHEFDDMLNSVTRFVHTGLKRFNDV